ERKLAAWKEGAGDQPEDRSAGQEQERQPGEAPSPERARVAVHGTRCRRPRALQVSRACPIRASVDLADLVDLGRSFDHAIDEAVLYRLLRAQPEVAVAVLLDLGH